MSTDEHSYMENLIDVKELVPLQLLVEYFTIFYGYSNLKCKYSCCSKKPSKKPQMSLSNFSTMNTWLSRGMYFRNDIAANGVS